MQALKCFSVLAYENTQVSMTLVNGEEDSALLCSTLLYLSLFNFTLISSHLLLKFISFLSCQCWWMGSCSLRYLSK